MDQSIRARKPVVYPTEPDTTIAVGDRVRSFDFPGDATCYWVGTVDHITKYGQYHITVEYQIWEGERAPVNYCAAVVPPVNGTQGIGGVFFGVQRILEGEGE